MRRVLQTSVWLLAAGASMAVFMAAGSWSASPLRWSDLSAWLDQARPEEAIVELARWVGIVVSGYVLIVSMLVLLADVAAAVRLVPVTRVLNRIGSATALPVLRRKLLHATTATAITVSSLSVAMTSGGVSAAPIPVTQTVDDVGISALLPDGLTVDAFSGFDIGSLPHSTPAAVPSAGDPTQDHVVVQAGDTVWDLAVDHYGTADAPMIHRLAELNQLADPGLIFRGQTLQFPSELSGSIVETAQPEISSGSASWAVHRIVAGDTLWDILDNHYGQVDADLVWTVADANGIENPSAIPIGTDVQLPPIGYSPDTPVDPVPEPMAQPGDSNLAVELPAPVDQPPVTLPPPVPGTLPTPAANPPMSPALTPMPTPTTNASSIPASVPAPTLTLVPQADPTLQPEHSAESVDTDQFDPGRLIGGLGSIALATGVVEWSRRRRRARWAVSGSAWQVGAAAETPAGLDEAADLTLIEWAGAALARLMSDTDKQETHVLSVELDESTLSVQWQRARPIAPAPWWAADNGWTWHLSRSAWLQPREDDPKVGLPALVTFGIRNGRQYLVNLAAVGSIAVDGALADQFAASLALEFAVGDELSQASVELVDLRLATGDSIDNLSSVTPEDALGDDRHHDPINGQRVVVSIVESDSIAAARLVERASTDQRHPVIVLGSSDLPTALDVRIGASGVAELAPSGVSFTACRVTNALVAIDPEPVPPAFSPAQSDPAPTSPELYGDESDRADEPETNVVPLDIWRAEPREPPQLLIRLFAARLPSFEPPVHGIGATQMRIVTALDSFEGGRAPARIAERLGLAEKTIRTHAAALFAATPPILHSDREIWTIDSGVCSDVDWMNDLAIAAREATSRQQTKRVLAECWELFERVTGPAYAGGGESKQWNWVHDRIDGTSPADNATRALVEAVTIAVECWDKLATETIEDLRSPASVVQILLRLERAISLAEPWALLSAAAKVARRAPESARQQIAMRLAQLAHDRSMEVPVGLVAEVV